MMHKPILNSHIVAKLLCLWLVLSVQGCATQSDRSRQVDSGPSKEEQLAEAFQIIVENQLKALSQELKTDLRLEVDEIGDLIRSELAPKLRALSPHLTEQEKREQKAQKAAGDKAVIGRIEWVDLKAHGIRVEARVDSGAQTSSMHAENIIEKVIDGEDYIQFETYDYEGKKSVLLKKVVTSTPVRSSSGETTKRFVIRKQVSLGGNNFDINVNLNDRTEMRYNFLIGRNLLMGNYVVDVSQTRVLGR